MTILIFIGSLAVTERLDDYENDVNRLLWPSQSPDVNLIEKPVRDFEYLRYFLLLVL